MKNRKETRAIETREENILSPRIISCRIHGTWYLIPGTWYHSKYEKTMNRQICHANITDDEMQLVGRIAEKLGYSSRTELVTALLRSLIHAKPFRKETEDLNSILTLETELETLQQTFLDILDEYAFPVIAMHGPDYAYRALADDLKAWMYQKCRAVPQDADLKEWTRLYYTMKKGDIIRYRISRTTEEFAEEYEEKENEAYA